MSDRYAALAVEGLSKTFHVPRYHITTLKERVLHPFRRTPVEELRALQDVSFRIAQGEFFGIVGRNGSGKSTLLKCMAGIYRADAGEVHIAGRLAPFIELGVGFNPDLTAYDNVVINAVMMGLTPGEAKERFPDVIAFAELEDFLDLRLKNYSSGMQVRLAFATMVLSESDVLLIDEVLAVGDASFQRKCMDVFQRLRGEGRTIVLVTHDMPTVERFCDRALLLEHGRIDATGEAGEVARRYLDLNFAATAPREELAAGGEAAADIVEATVSRADGERADAIPHGETARLDATIEVHREVIDPQVRVWVDSAEGVRVFAATTRDDADVPDAFQPGQRLRVALQLRVPLEDGHYFVGADITRGSTASEIVAHRPRIADFIVYGAPDAAGLVDLPHELSLAADPEPQPTWREARR